MLNTSIIKYHFEPYNDVNGENAIRFCLSSINGNNYSFDSATGKLNKPKLSATIADSYNIDVFNNFKAESEEFSWNSYGTSFKLTADGNLHLSKINQDHNPRFEINGANIVKLGGQNFKQLHIISKEINFMNDCAIGDLKVSASSILNNRILNVETANILASRITNPGEIQASKTAKIKSIYFDNQHGGVHAGIAVKLTTEHLQNEQGNLSGINHTYVKIGKSFTNNENSEIGVSGKTTIVFKNNMEIEKLGIIRGEQVELINPAVVKGNGIISANQEVLLTSTSTIVMPQIDIQTPMLKLQAPNFQLGNQTYCEHTVFQTKVGDSVTLTNEYRTTGTFEFQESNVNFQNIQKIMQQRFGDIDNYHVDNLPDAKYNISVQATIQANRGITALTPNAKLSVGVNEGSNHPELLAESGDLTVYVTEFDLEKGGAATKNGFVWAPKGFSLGRLITDPNRQAFATFYMHSQISGSSNLGGNIQPINFQFLGQNREVYDGKHLLIMPIAIPNHSFLSAKESIKIVGQFNHRGNLSTRYLNIDSTSGSSIWEASMTKVDLDCVLNGNFILKRVTTVFDFIYHNWCGTHINCSYNQCNSDPAILVVKGKLSGNATIFNEASILDIHEKSPEVQVNSKDFISARYQQFISGTDVERQALSTSTAAGQIHSNGICCSWNRPFCCSRGSINVASELYVPYAMGFLAKTNNFKDSQTVFPAITSFNSKVILPTRDSYLEGFITAHEMLVSIKGRLKSGSPNPYFINSKNPIRDLMSKGFNLHTTYYMPDEIKNLIEQAALPKFHFLFRERFWFNDKESQEFYQAIFEHIVIKNVDGGFTKPNPQTVFSLSPNYLIERVREECQEVLMRGFIYEGQAIDLDLIQELHKNTTEYLKGINGSEQAFQQALVLTRKSTTIEAPPKPMLYYQAFTNDQQGLEVLTPYLYIPEAMINEVRAQHGELTKTNMLVIFPEDLTPKELIDFSKNRPALQNSLIKFFDTNPNVKEYVYNNAITIKAKQEQNQLTVSTQPGSQEVTNSNVNNIESSVTMSGTIQAKKLAVITKGSIVVHGQLETENALLASLCDDVEIKSLIGKIVKDGNQNNFDYAILSQARVHASNLLQIFAGKNVIFEGAETDSGVMTQVHALANILDVPIALIHQRVQHFYGKRKSVFTKDTYLEQKVSKHKTGDQGNICMVADNSAILQAPVIEGAEASIISIEGETKILSATEAYGYDEQIIEKKNSIFGPIKKTTNITEYIERAKGAEFKVQRLIVAGNKGIELSNIHSTAERNILYSMDGEIAILLGRNSFAASRNYTRSDPFWQRSKSENVQQLNYSESSISGTLEIHAERTILETVRGKTLSFLQQIDQNQGEVIYTTLDEYYSRQTKTVQGPGSGLIALVGIATFIATQGVASGWASALLKTGEGIAHTMITAGFQGLCSKAAASIVANNGDPIKSIKSLASEDTIKSLATTMVSAGVMHKVCNALNIPKLTDREFLDHAKYNIIKSSVSATLSMSIDGQNMEDAILDGIVNAAIGTVTASLVAKTDVDKIDDIKHNILQTILGGAKGTLVGDNGALVGALDGLISAIMPNDLFVSDEEANKGSINVQEKEDQGETNLENKEKGKDRLKISDEYDVILYENRDKEQILAQQRQRLAEQIISNLNLQRYLQANLAGVNVDINQMEAIIIKKINSMDIKDLIKLEREFDFYRLQHNETRQFKVANAIFENELPKGSNVPTEGDKSFWKRLIENYVKLNTEEIEVDIALNRSQAHVHADELSKDIFSESSSSHQTSDASFVDKLLIGSGRAFVSTGQGVKQLGLAIGEKLGVIEDGATANYTAEINAEKELYNLTQVGKSLTAKSSEVLTEVAMSVVIPGSVGSTGARLIAESAAAGAIIGGIQATEDGSLSSRSHNAGIGAVEGAAGGYMFNKTAQGLHWAWKEGKTQYGLYTFDKKVEVSHVFSKAKGGQAPKVSSSKPRVTSQQQATSSSHNASRECARNNFRISSKLKSPLFTPAFDEISSFSVKSYLDGALYPTEKLPILVKYLEKRGVHVYEAIKDPCFIARKEGMNHIYLTPIFTVKNTP